MFVTQALTQLFNWSGTLTGPEGERVPDPGIGIDTPAGVKRITTASATASFALSEELRLPFLQKVAELTPTSVFSGQTQVVLGLPK